MMLMKAHRAFFMSWRKERVVSELMMEYRRLEG